MESRYPDGQHPPIAALERFSFSDEAARMVAANASGREIVYGKSITDVWGMMEEGRADALLPFENSSGGVVWPHLHKLRNDPRAAIVGEVLLNVRMAVGGITPDALERATVACSHPKGLEQTTVFREAHPRLRGVKEFSSTVDAARYVSAEGSIHNIAFASRLALEDAGLHVLGEDVANDKGTDNVTQFFLVRRNGERALPHPEARHHAAFITPENAPGVLHAITGVIKSARVDLRSIQSRNIGRKSYEFFVEMTRLGTPKQFDLMARTLQELDETKSIRWLGSWDDQWENS